VTGSEAVAERQAVPDAGAADSALGDIADVVLEPPAVRPPGEVTAENAEPVPLPYCRGGRDREVEPELVRRRIACEVEVRLLQPGEQHGGEIGAVGLLERTELRIELVQQLGQNRARVVLLELLV